MAEEIQIRVADRRDTSRIDALLARSYPKLLKADYPPSVLVTALPLISRAQPRLIASGTYYVAETAAGEIVGAGGWTRQRRRPEIGDIRHVVTDDRWLRRGIGRAIMDRVFVVARGAGVRLLDCWATRTAVPFYQAMGFVPLGPIEIELRPAIKFPAIQMQRRL